MLSVFQGLITSGEALYCPSCQVGNHACRHADCLNLYEYKYTCCQVRIRITLYQGWQLIIIVYFKKICQKIYSHATCFQKIIENLLNSFA
jgi:hypothetical protein